ncbi:hypothetical protein CONCODRAFT_70801 [Conidiobolus coronatus NRRL 28638]|uniref:Uncharacterized protein n=1 Tax=Conidiobolus coronatus (strain ATCC 28846 / CBS 209.66 / NRRL 28638) TaxID=796925 RepID=A0A137P5N4_CONC2|nr:hypothetical protein CONCODRAFT_70801 [Conidiobolus coronatus NRRL 28638]|eukprot:KXN70269.1 hypothetical protein CONCODRAFT_70801 [Conidiobolus coronatus NRRL 28638]
MRNDILLIGLIPLISALPQLSYKYTAAHREGNGLLSNFTSSSEQEEVSNHQSNAKTNAVMADNQLANQIASLQTPSGAGVIPSQATTELQMKMQKAFQDFANAVAQIASDAQLQASQLTVNPNAFAPPAIAATPQQTPQAQPQPQPQPQPQSQPDANAQPSSEPNPQPSQEEAPQAESEAPAPTEENSEQPSPAGSTRSLLDDLMASTDDNGSEVSSSDNYQFQFQSSPLPAYNPVYVKYDYPTVYDVSSVPAYSYYTAAYPAAYSVASYNGYADPSIYHNLARSKPSADPLQAASTSSSVNHSQKLASSSVKPKSKELPDVSTIHSSQEIKSLGSSSSSSSSHQQQKLSAASTKPKPEAIPAKPATSQKNSLQASSIHPQQASPLAQESQFKASIVSEQSSTIPSQSPSAPSSPSQLDKVLTQIETEAAPMLKRRERFNNMADHRVVIKDKFSDAQQFQEQQQKMRKTRKQHKLF